jgi:hypothetical protein
VKAFLRLKHKADESRDRLRWAWRGGMTSLADFGMPTGTTAVTLCIYAGTSALEYTVPGGANWRAVGARHAFSRKERFRYRDPTGTFDGIRTVVLRTGEDGRTKALMGKILVKGAGINLPNPTLPLTVHVTAQFVNSSNDVCFTSTFTGPKKSTSTAFKARSP